MPNSKPVTFQALFAGIFGRLLELCKGAIAAELGVVMLILLGLVKLFATSSLLATGWKGGYIFSILFASVALGRASKMVTHPKQ